MAMTEIKTYMCTLCGFARSMPWTISCPACQDGKGTYYGQKK